MKARAHQARASFGRLASRGPLVLLVWLGGLGACGRSESSAAPPSPASAPAASASAAVLVAQVDAAPAPTTASFSGAYTAAVGTLTMPAGAPSWSGDDADAGTGPGTLSFTIDARSGHIEGKGDGALGDVVVNGQLGEGGVLTFTLLRATPTDGGFTGVGYGTRTPDGKKIEGTLRASTARGNMLREATFTLSAR